MVEILNDSPYIIPDFIDGNVMYCSIPKDDGGTTLLKITLR